MNRRAFTLIELVGTFALLVLIITISAMAIGSTLKQNQDKTNKIKIENVYRSTEDYILKNNIKLSENVPLYFSVNALSEENILSSDINTVIRDVLNLVGDNFFIEANKVGENIRYDIITINDFKTKTGITDFSGMIASTWGIEYLPGDTKTVRENSDFNIKFRLHNGSSVLHNLYLKNIKYDLINEKTMQKVVADGYIVKNLKQHEDGSYSFLVNNNLETGIYRLSLKISPDFGYEITSDNYLTLVNTDGAYKPLITSVSTQVDTWHNAAEYKFNVSGEQLISKKKADVINYNGYRYNNQSDYDNKINGIPVNGSFNTATGSIEMTLTTSGIYDLAFTSEISAPISSLGTKITGNTKDVVIKLDNVAPVVSISQNPTTGWVASVTLTCNITEANSGIQYQTLNGVNQLTATITAAGTYNCVVRDLAGNETTVSHTVSNIDNVYPIVTIEYVSSVPLYEMTLRCNVSDNSGSYSRAWYAYSPITYPTFPSFSSDPNATFIWNGTRYCKGTDPAGNSTLASYTVSGMDDWPAQVKTVTEEIVPGGVRITVVGEDPYAGAGPVGLHDTFPYYIDYYSSGSWQYSTVNQKIFPVGSELMILICDKKGSCGQVRNLAGNWHTYKLTGTGHIP